MNSYETWTCLCIMTTTCNTSDSYYCPNHVAASPRGISVYCITTDSAITYDTNTNTYTCANGNWILIDNNGNYFDVQNQSSAPEMTYNSNCTASTCPCSTTTCTYGFDGTTWSFGTCNDISAPVPTNNEFIITYQN